MTDNRTTELREMLTERGVEYTTNDHMGAYETSWNGFTAMQLTPGAKLLMVFTPDQAIAATLGSGKPFIEAIAELRKIVREAFSGESVSMLVEGHAIMRAIDEVETATLGDKREKALEELVRDMWREITTCPDYTVPPCMTDGICERVRNLGVEMGGDDDE